MEARAPFPASGDNEAGIATNGPRVRADSSISTKRKALSEH